MENVIDKTIIRVEQPSPYHGYRCRSCYHRKEDDGSVNRTALHLSVKKYCKNKCDDNGKRNLHDRIFECVDQCLPDLFICKNLLIVL